MFSNNLKRLSLPKESLARHQPIPSEGQVQHNLDIFEWTVRQARKKISNDVVDRTLTNRRSEFSDEALMNDFFKFEQPVHKITRDEHYLRALKRTKEMFQPHRILYPVAYPDLRYYTTTLTTAAEAPWNIPGWRFQPTNRNVDLESEIPKVSTGFEDNWNDLFKEWKTILRKRKLRLNFSEDIDVDKWLALKQKHGIITDSARSKHNLYPEIHAYNRYLIHQIKDGDEPFWIDGQPRAYYHATLHARSHVVANDEIDKIRAVFGSTWLLLHAELMFIWNLQHIYQNHPQDGKMLWGYEIMRGGWKKIWIEATRNGEPSTTLSLDWSEFDKRLLFELMDDVHEIWKSYFSFTNYEDTSFYNGDDSKCDPNRINRLWSWMCFSIKYTPILLPDGSLWKWLRNGFGSGFQQTQLMDSFANMIMILTCLSKLGINIDSELFWILVQGDDSIIAFFERVAQIYGPTFLVKFAECAGFYFNAKVSRKKSLISRSLDQQYVLGYHNDDGMPSRTTEDLLRHLLFPETMYNSYDRQITVLIGLAYASCGTNDEFFQFAKFAYEKLKSKGATPNPRYIRRFAMRLKMLGITEEEELVFPDKLQMISKCSNIHQRSEYECERVWPTRPGPRGRFFFFSE